MFFRSFRVEEHIGWWYNKDTFAGAGRINMYEIDDSRRKVALDVPNFFFFYSLDRKIRRHKDVQVSSVNHRNFRTWTVINSGSLRIIRQILTPLD